MSKTVFLFSETSDRHLDRSGEIQMAVNDAVPGDIIVLGAGTYYIGKTIAITSDVKIADVSSLLRKTGNNR